MSFFQTWTCFKASIAAECKILGFMWLLLGWAIKLKCLKNRKKDVLVWYCLYQWLQGCIPILYSTGIFNPYGCPSLRHKLGNPFQNVKQECSNVRWNHSLVSCSFQDSKASSLELHEFNMKFGGMGQGKAGSESQRDETHSTTQELGSRSCFLDVF